MALTDPISILIIISSFIASAVSSTFALGGGFIMLAVIASVVPINAVVPLHSATMLGTSLSRSWFFRGHTHWAIVIPFITGSIIGAILGARIYVDLPEVIIATVIGILIIAAVWFPSINWRPSFSHPFFYVGVVHSFLSALFSFGGLLQPIMMRTRLLKMQIIATLAVSLLIMNIFKLLGYFLFGFNFKPYIALIFAAIIAGIPGALLGKKLVYKISEERFRMVFKVIMTIFAVRLLYRAWQSI